MAGERGSRVVPADGGRAPGRFAAGGRLWQTGISVVVVDSPEQAAPSPDVIPCLACGSDEAALVQPGTIDARGGQAAYDAVVAAARLAREGRVDAITTAPLHKEALRRAGHNYPGHTELLAELCGVQDFAMMLYLGPDEQIDRPAGLAVVHVTLHTAMRNVFRRTDRRGGVGQGPAGRSLHAPAEGSAAADRRVPPQSARRAKADCSATKSGPSFGRPSQRALAEGLDVEGPLPTDTLMVQARDGRFDAVVAMYHDQGHIALKLLGMHRAVNVTLGLPIVRTSVAHGTAFDIAWQRKAETGSMIEALRVASRLAKEGGG